MNEAAACLFCDIRDKKIKAEVVYEDDHTIGLLDIQPRAPGHTMVIPKVHAETILDLPDEEIGPLFLAVKRLAGAVLRAVGASGLTVGVNHGRASGQIVNHLHVHLLPRFEGDRGGSVHSVVNNPPAESVSETAEKIRSKLQ